MEPVNILLVDDHRENLVALSSILTHPDYRLVLATSGDQALSALLKEEFAVILLDVMMPEMDGYQVASIIKEREATQYIPILFLTAVALDVRHIFRGYEVGAVDYLLKPLEAEIVQKKVEVFADLFRKEREIKRQTERLREMERRESDEWYATTLKSIGDAVIATDSKGMIRFMNPVAESLTGCELSEVRGTALETVLQLSDEENGQPLEDPAARVLKEGAVIEFTAPAVLRARNGNHYMIEDAGSPIRSDEKGILGAVFVFRDVTEKRWSERRRAFVSKASSVLLSSFDYRRNLEDIARLAVSRVVEACIIDVSFGELPLERVAAAHADPKKEDALWDLEVLETSGLEPMRIRVPLHLRDSDFGTITLFSEGKRRFQPADLEMAQNLADRIAASLESAQLYDAAQRAVRLRDEFLSIASHELRTPITPLKLQFDTMTRLIKSQSLLSFPQEKLKRMVNITGRQMERLTQLIEELLDVSRISIGKMKIERQELDLATTIQEIVSQFAEELERVKSEVVIHTQSIVGYWDRLRIEQVLINLLGNAMKYGAGKPIEITLERSGSGAARLRVRDHGIGISPQDQKRIFERYERAASHRNYAGLGLGLYISRQIVEAHGGTIDVDSKTGEGSTFTVELPLKPAESDRQAA